MATELPVESKQVGSEQVGSEQAVSTSAPRKLSPTWLTLGAAGLVLLGLLFISLNLAQNRESAATAYSASIDRNDESAVMQEMLRISDELECPICEGQSVAYSNSMLATEMRAEVSRQLEAGANESEIKQYFVDRYGEMVLREPSRSGFNQVLWLMPFIALGMGVLILLIMLLQTSRNRRAVQTAGESVEVKDDAGAVDQEIEDLLSQYDEELFASKRD